jgi:ABC-type uncharacterized transport system substrate-binding protein
MIITMKKSLFLSLFLAVIFFTTQAFAHSYHYELQVTNALQTNDKNELEALKLTFLYDGEVSKVMLQDQKNLDKLGKTLIKDLGKLGYFTQVKLNGKVLNTNKAQDIKLEKISVKSKSASYDALQLHFTLVLKKPVSIAKNSEIMFVHEDPTEAAILYYENADHILVEGNLKDNCKSSVKEKSKFAEGEFPQIIRVHCKS